MTDLSSKPPLPSCPQRQREEKRMEMSLQSSQRNASGQSSTTVTTTRLGKKFTHQQHPSTRSTAGLWITIMLTLMISHQGIRPISVNALQGLAITSRASPRQGRALIVSGAGRSFPKARTLSFVSSCFSSSSSSSLFQSSSSEGEGSSESSPRKKAKRSSSFFFADWVDVSSETTQATTRTISTTTVSEETAKEEEEQQQRPFRILFLGTPDVAAETLQTLYEASQKSLQANGEMPPFEIAGVVTQPPRKRNKRKKTLVQSPVGQLALDLDLPLLTPEKANSKRFLDQLSQESEEETNDTATPVDYYSKGMAPIDLCITAAYGQYLPKRFLATPAKGTVNIHPSWLPQWRGASPVQRALEAGDENIGCTVLYTVSAMDAGPIIDQCGHNVHDNDTATNILPTMFQKGTSLLLDNLPDILNDKITMETARPQTEEDATAASLIHSTEGQLRVWEENAVQCLHKYRGFSMWPQTYMYVQVVQDDTEHSDNEPLVIKIKVTQARVLRATDGTPDRVEPTRALQMGPNKKTDGLYVVTHDGTVLELLQVQPAGRPKPFAARDLQNGYPKATLEWIVQDDADHVPAATEKKKTKKNKAAAAAQ